MKKTAKVISNVTRSFSSIFVSASSPMIHAPKIPESLKETK